MEGADVFVTNYAFLDRRLAEIAKYICVTNYLVAEQEPESFNLLNDIVKFVPYWLSYCLLPSADTCFIRSVGYPKFGADFRENISWRSTVSFFAMQIAYALGYKKVLLVGFDHNYTQPKSVEGDLIDQKEMDPNHFDPRYFKGKKWQAADTNNMEEMYKLAKIAFESDGREIINCTDGGKLEVFRRGHLPDELGIKSDTPNENQITDMKEVLANIKRDSLIAALPKDLQDPIFLPTDRVPIERQITGLRRVKELYSRELDRLYRPKLESIKKSRTAKRCFIIGNGPSLNETDLSLLEGEVTFATNGFFLKSSDLNWSPTYYVVEDHLVAEDRAREINSLRGSTKLFPANLRYILEPDAHTVFFEHCKRVSYPHGFDFSFEATSNTFAGGTVTYTCLQLAAYFGFEEIYLIGVDASYVIPSDAELSGASRVKEIDMKSDDPNHFHPDYFGKGKRWHEPNVDIMIEAYAEAKRACDAKGIKIANATVGGKLEVFPRVAFESLFLKPKEYPRLLLIDLTKSGNGTATGELKASLFSEWPDHKLMQIYVVDRDTIGLHHHAQSNLIDLSDGIPSDAIDSAISAFGPEIILYRPTPDTEALHSVAMDLTKRLGVPLATWIMDDWPTAIAGKSTSKKSAEKLNSDWKFLLKNASVNFSICDAMSEAFTERYDVPFVAIANGIEPSEWPNATLKSVSKKIVVRYAGSLAENMTLSSVRLVAEAVQRLADDGLDISFEIKTRELWHQSAHPHFKGLSRTTFIVADMERLDYQAWLSAADVLVIGYNFDEESKAYIQYSLANKLPECLASGAALLAIGPRDVATIKLLDYLDCGLRVTTNDVEVVYNSLRQLATSADLRFRVAQKAQQTASSQFNINSMRDRLLEHLERTVAATPPEQRYGHPRSVCAEVDETAVVARLLVERAGPSHIMLDVGAHVGTSAAYFENLGWTIKCFEPDQKNRKNLSSRFQSATGITIDPRAVSDAPATGVKFYTSPESTGISGLLAFRDTHVVSNTVDVTTVAEIIISNQLKRVDFLKIDVEGYDLNVLKGVPWDTVKPDVIECEFEDAKTLKLGHTWKTLVDFLQEHGYSVYISEWHPIVRYGIAHDWRRVTPYVGQDVSAKAWGNLLAFREDPGYDAVSKAFNALVKFREKSGAEVALDSNAKNSESTVPVLQKTSQSALLASTQSSQPGRYQRVAEKIHSLSPSLYGALRFARRALTHIVSRPSLLLPLVLVSGLIIAALIVPGLAAFRLSILAIATVGLLSTILAYVAFRSFSHVERLHLKVASQGSELKLLREQIAANRVAVSEQMREALSSIWAPRLEKLASSHAEFRAQLAAESKRISDESKRISDESKRIEALTTRLETSEANEANIIASTDTLRKTSTNQIDALTDKLNSVEKWSQYDNANWYQSFNRRLTSHQAHALESDWRKRLSVPVSKAIVGYMATRACAIERQLEGRLATSIEDMLLRSLVARAVKGRTIDVLEIGTLFGTGAAIMFDTLANHYEEIHFTLLDPLEGYYNSSQADILTGQPIDEETLRRNLAKVGMTEDQFTLIKMLSTDTDAIKAAGERKYDVLVIDADHSYAGVKTDFENYAQWVKIGGYIIFDDYSSPDWPDVQEYVDSELADVEYISRVGASWRTCVYRVVKSPAPFDKSGSKTKSRARKAVATVEAVPTEPE